MKCQVGARLICGARRTKSSMETSQHCNTIQSLHSALGTFCKGRGGKKEVNIMAVVSVYVTLSFSECAAAVSTWIIPVAI